MIDRLPTPAAPRRAARAGAAWAALGIAVALALAAAAPAAGKKFPRPSGERVWSLLARHPLHTLDGAVVPVDALHGEIVVLHFWASWCAPCRRELPALDRLHADLAARGGRVLAISIDRDPENARRFARRLGLRLPIVLDGPDALARELDLASVPFTIVLDKDGAVAFTTARAGAEAMGVLTSGVQRLLAGGEPAAGVAR